MLKQLDQNISMFPEQIESQTELIDTLRKKYGHKLFHILDKFNNIFTVNEQIKLEIDKFPNAERMFKEGIKKEDHINPRYDVIPISAKEAVEIIDATLNIFELVSDKFLKPLYRFMYYPELEEGYDEYFSRLDDDYFDE